jgi:quercetin dioxygenase-like cupin family protein
VQIVRNSLENTRGPAGSFPGAVYRDMVTEATEDNRFTATLVHVTPGARTAWHSRPLGQTIFVTQGIGRCQRRGGPVEVLYPGDRVFFEPGEDRWNGAAPDRFMSRPALQQPNEDGVRSNGESTWPTRTTRTRRSCSARRVSQ